MKVFLTLFFGLIIQLGIAQTKDQTSVLFIGNSFTFYNDMPFLFKDIAASFGHNVAVDTVVKGGKNLKYHSEQPLTYEKIAERKWDYVVIQGHSDEFAQYDKQIIANTLPYIEKILKAVKENNSCTKVFLYMTWAYKEGNPKWEVVDTYPKMQDLVEKQYLRTSDFLSLEVSPVGAVWREVRQAYPSINLYVPDNHHPTLNGSYISACTFYTSIFGKSPFGSTLNIQMEPKIKKDIELITAEIVLNNRPKWRQMDYQQPMEVGFDLIQNNDSLILVNNAKNYTSVEWFLGDGTHADNSTRVEHQFTSPGEYEITQRLSNACGIKELTRTIQVRP